MVVYSETDSGYAWVILAISTMMAFKVGFVGSAMSVLLVEFGHTFNISKLQLSVIATCLCVIGPTSVLFFNWMNKVFGPRITTLFNTVLMTSGHIAVCIKPTYLMTVIAYGCVTSIGLWMSYTLTFTCVQLYFNKNRSIASGMINSGVALGMTFGPIITQALLSEYALQGCMLLQAGFMLQGFVYAALYRPPQRDKPKDSREDIFVIHEKTENKLELGVSSNSFKNIIEKKVVGCFRIWKKHFVAYSIFLFGFFLIVMSHFYAHIYAPLTGELKGLSAEKGALLLTVAGGTGALMRPISGLIGNHKIFENKHVIVFGLGCLINGIIILLSTLCHDFLTMTIYMASYGAVAGVYYGILSVSIGDLLCTKYADIGSGLLILCHALAFAIENPVTGWLMDNFTPESPSYLFGSTQITGGIIITSLYLLLKRRSKRSDIYMVN